MPNVGLSVGGIQGSASRSPAGVVADINEIILIGADTAIDDDSGNGQSISLNGSTAPARVTTPTIFTSAGAIEFFGGTDTDDRSLSFSDSRNAAADGDWTFECFIRRNNPQSDTFVVLCGIATDTKGWYVRMNSVGGCEILLQDTPAVYTQGGFGAGMTVDTYEHFALVKTGDDGAIYINGTRTNNNTGIFAGKDWDAAANETIHVGGPAVDITTQIGSFDGYMDEIRVRNEAVYSGASLTVPTAIFPRP